MKKIMLFGLVFVLLISIVNATPKNDTMIHLYEFEQVSGQFLDAGNQSTSLTYYGTDRRNGSKLGDYSFNSTNNDAYLSYATKTTYYYPTYAFWIWQNQPSATCIFSDDDDGSLVSNNIELSWGDVAGKLIYWYVGTTSETSPCTSAYGQFEMYVNVSPNTWTHVAFGSNQTHCFGYVNGSIAMTRVKSVELYPRIPNDAGRIGNCQGHLGHDYAIDQWIEWQQDPRLTNPDIFIELYNYGAGWESPFSVPNVFDLRITTPVEYETLTPPYFFVNTTANSTVNCTINDTRWDNYWNNSANYSFNNNTKIDDPFYSVNVNCSNSIGGIANVTRNFYVITDLITPTLNWSSPTTIISSIGLDNTINLTVNVTDNYRKTTTFFLYNSSKAQIANATVVDSGGGSHFYNYMFSNLTANTYYVNASHTDLYSNTGWSPTLTLVRVGIDNCSTYTTRAVNITVRSDYTDALVNTNIRAYFELWDESLTSVDSFNLTWDLINQSGICIYPNDSINVFYTQFEYGGTGVYSAKSFFLLNYTLSNETQPLNLYLTPNSTLVTFTVTDQDDRKLKDVYIHILKYDLGTDSYKTSEIIRSDELGQALGTIILSTQWYKFMLVYNYEVVLETEPVKITSTTRNFRVDLVTSFFDYYDTWNNIQTSLTFTNATLNFAYTFINTLGTNVKACLNVVRLTAMSDTLINETCVTSASGTILINIGVPGGNTFKAVGTVEASPLDVTNILVVTLGENYKKWGKDGIFAAFLVRMSLATIGIWNPLVAIILLILADIGMISMGLYFLNWQTLIFYIILAGITLYRINRK